MNLPVSLNTVRKQLLCCFTIFFLLMLIMPGSAGVYQLSDVTTDKGIVNYRVENQYSQDKYYFFGWNIPVIGENWYGKVSTLPFIGGYGEKSSSIDYNNNTYFIEYDKTEIFTHPTDAIGKVSFKISMPRDGDLNEYILPVKFSTNNTSGQYYIKIKENGDLNEYTYKYLISVCDENQTAFLNKSVAPLTGGSFIITFENEILKINRVNSNSNFVDLWDNETGQPTCSIPYSNCNNLQFDISGYPYPVQCNFKDCDGFELAKEFDSIPMKIYWLINQIIPDNNQNLYYFFKAVDTVWSLSLGIIILCFSMPFMWLFFAGICGLCACVLRGSITSGIPAGIKTFVTVALIPVKLMGFILEMIARLITAIKPI